MIQKNKYYVLIDWVGGPDGKIFGSWSGRTNRAQWFHAIHLVSQWSLLAPQVVYKLQNTNILTKFSREQFVATNLFRIVFAGPYAFLVGPYTFFRPYHLDTYGTQTRTFFLWFFLRKLRAGPYGSHDKNRNWLKETIFSCVQWPK